MSISSPSAEGVRLAELLAVMSLGADLGMNQPMEHVLRQSQIALRLGELLGFDEAARASLYHSSLIVWVGCHIDAYEQAKWFGDDFALKGDSRLIDATGTAPLKFLASHLGAAVAQALSLVQGPPPFLAAGRPTAGLDVTSTRDAWARWAQTPTGSAADPGWLGALADHLEGVRSGLAATVGALSAQASDELRLRDDQWAPLAAEVAAWCADAEPVLAALSVVPALKKARSWLVAATAELRAARLAPLADQARAIWAMLRQESNVDLGVFRLASTGPQRKLELDVSIDGAPGAALGVMSQGEINALALSVFLPRAAMPQSPFRFLVIDDPVQAMDPAKVDGLARVLDRVASDRQVIVFTHDNRLATAIRDLDIEATILEVTRRPGSIVQVRTSLDPVSQPLADASAVNTDDKVPAAVASRVVPGLCRSAVEAALTRSIWRQQLRSGRTRQEIETGLDAARRRLVSLASLAFFGSSQQGGQVLTRLNREGRPFGDTFQALNRGAHEPYADDLTQLISASRKLAAKVDEISP